MKGRTDDSYEGICSVENEKKREFDQKQSQQERKWWDLLEWEPETLAFLL
jgi:hypothetical protein